MSNIPITRYCIVAMALIVVLCTLSACGRTPIVSDDAASSVSTTTDSNSQTDHATGITTTVVAEADTTTTNTTTTTVSDTTKKSKTPTTSTTAKPVSTKKPSTSPSKPTSGSASGYIDADKCDHKNTELIIKEEATLYKDGFTGSVKCKDCGIITKGGKFIPRLEETDTHMAVYDIDHNRFIIEKGVDPLLYSMRKLGKKTNRIYKDFEEYVLEYTNAERAKEGLAPLKYLEDATYYTYIRAKEISGNFSHYRVDYDSSSWDTVYFYEGLYLSHGSMGENIGELTYKGAKNASEMMVKLWMESPGHRSQIMNPDYTHLAVGAYWDENVKMTCLVQHFFEFKE